eukprot:jgi/Chlat1/521/Chrsp103S00011
MAALWRVAAVQALKRSSSKANAYSAFGNQSVLNHAAAAVAASAGGSHQSVLSTLPFGVGYPGAARCLASSAAAENQKQQKQQDLVSAEEEFDAITDKIPERPVTAVEGASWSIVILAALGIAAVTMWAVFKELVLEPTEYIIFGKSLKRVQDDNRVVLRIGSPISGYGEESRNRAARQRIRHREYKDAEGTPHMQARDHAIVQFHVRGPTGTGIVNADMYKKGKEWEYSYLYTDITAPYPTRIVLEPRTESSSS